MTRLWLVLLVLGAVAQAGEWSPGRNLSLDTGLGSVLQSWWSKT